MDQIISYLMDIGLNEIEAKVYLYLVSNPSSTGYKIAKDIKKPAANTYKSIDLLLNKGLLLLDKSSKNKYSAISYNDFLLRQKNEYLAKIEKTKKLFLEVKEKKPNIAIYNLTTKTQIYEKFTTLINNAKNAITLDIYPSIDEPALTLFRSAIKRGVSVYIKTYKSFPDIDSDYVIDHRGENIYYGGQKKLIHMTVDHNQLLLSEEEGNNINYALWTENHDLVIHHSYGFLMEFVLDKAISAYENGSPCDIKAISETYREKIFKDYKK